MQGLADHPAVHDVVDGDPLLVEGLRVVRRVLRVGDLDRRHLLGGGAVVVHVAHERRSEVLACALPPIRPVVEGAAAERGGSPSPGSPDPHLREAVHRPEDHHRVAHARLDHPDRDPDQGLGARATTEAVHVEVEADAEVAGDERRERRVVPGVAEHAVDVVGGHAGVDEGVVDRPGREVARGLGGAPPVGRLADADDRVLVPQERGRRGVDVGVEGGHDPFLAVERTPIQSDRHP